MIDLAYFGRWLTIRVMQYAIYECLALQPHLESPHLLEEGKVFLHATKLRTKELLMELSGNLDSTA